MENSKRRIFIDVLLVFTCLLVLATIAYHFYSQNKKGKAYKAQEYALKEQVVWDLYYHYENLKDFASSWKSYYAKLSLNRNRDTIAHPKYTVKELTRLHHRIISGIANYENNAVITHYKIDISQISDLYPVSYGSRQLLSTYQFREKLYEQAKELNSIYVSLLNNTRVTDSVDTSYNTESKFYAYFSSLRRLDEVIYELLSDEYPISLKYAVSTENDFTISAKNRLFSTQVSNLRLPSEYHVYTPEALYLKQNMMTCLGEKNALIKNLEFEVNQGKALLLVLADTLKNESLEQNKIARTLFSCYATMKKDYDRELFLYIEDQDGRAQIAWPRQKELVELSEQNRDTLFKFYAEKSSPYIIEGTYTPHYEWYPKAIDEAIKAYNDAP